MLKVVVWGLCLATATARLAVDHARPEQVTNRPSLIDYNPVANTAAVVISSDKLARFTVLTSRLIRMEYAKSAGVFEDYSTIAILNRNLPVPVFTQSESAGKLVITTADVVLTYLVGSAFSASSLFVSPRNTGAFGGWKFGDADTGNLLGTIRGLDGQNQTPLNCTLNKPILDNGEDGHCEWGVVSRDGWVVYDDSKNYILDKNDWWVPNNAPPPPRSCSPGKGTTDANSPTRSTFFPDGTTAPSADECCAICLNKAADCLGWVWASDGSNSCWLLAGWDGTTDAPNRIFGQVGQPVAQSMQNRDGMDLYGFFHGHDYFGALNDFVSVSGKTIMVPKYVSGIWWSRWFNLNNLDLVKITEDYGSRSIPLDVFVIDMDWHTKDDWSGFTFDSHLFPFPADSVNYLKQLGLPVTLNIHDASGVNSWEALFPNLVQYLGMSPSSKVVPFNILNATVAYAVEDIVLGDLIYNKSVAFWWIDWQQGGNRGGMMGDKQNPTMWLNHLRCTDRHRVGDETRALVLGRWGGMGGHRYQVGFSGDVAQLTWANLAYQPYFSATASNVGHGFWSHDIEGPADDAEMYTRWIQVGAFSGTMRSHDRGMSGGGCANDDKFSCAIVEPWNVPNVNFPNLFMEANRQALQFRAHLLPYVYNGHRAAFDTGVGLIRPMYYHYPDLDGAYVMDATGNGVQYMFGPSILFSPVVIPGDKMVGLAPLADKSTWLPPGTWVDANTGVMTVVSDSDKAHIITSTYGISEVPLWYQGGAVIPYIPLRSLRTSVGNAAKQYNILGFKVVPGQNTGSTRVYEDDGATTQYLTQNAFAWTVANYTVNANAVVITISTMGTFKELPANRAYQIRLLNFPPILAATVNGAAINYNRYGKIAATGGVPPVNQFYYDFSLLPEGMGPVIDIVNVATKQTLTVTIKLSPQPTVQQMSGVYGAVTHALLAKANLDIERSTPGSNQNEPAYTNVLSSVGQALEYSSNTDVTYFTNTVTNVPQLLKSAVQEIQNLKSPRKDYSIALLQAVSS